MTNPEPDAEPGWGGPLGWLAVILNKLIMLFAGKGKGDNGKPE